MGRYLHWPTHSKRAQNQAHFYQDLSFLFNEQPGPAVMAVIENLPINPETLQSHLSLAKLLRDRGEIEGATRIHQSLLSSPALEKHLLEKVHFALAQDYISAGLLDRAESLLQDLLQTTDKLQTEVLERLQHIYQSERDWEKAIAVAKQRLKNNKEAGSSRSQPIKKQVLSQISHYYCELAEQELGSGDADKMTVCLDAALEADSENVRAVLLSARQQLRAQPQRVLSRLHRLMLNHSDYVREVLPLYRDAFAISGQMQQYLSALESLAENIDSSTLQQEIIHQRLEQGEHTSAEVYFREALKRRPTVKLLTAFPELATADRATLSKAVLDIEQGKPSYRCRHCGFSGQRLHWMCPGCEDWGTIAPIRGKQGD